MKQRGKKNERHKSEDAKYFKGLQKRLAKLDHAECIELAKELTTEAREEDGDDMFMCAGMAEELFGIRERDIHALVEIGALKTHDTEECPEPVFLADEMRVLFENAAKAKASKEKPVTKAAGAESKTEDPKYYKGLQKRFAELDHEECARIAREEIRMAVEEGAEDRILCPCWVHSKLGIKKRDLYALADLGEFRVIHDLETSLPHFSAIELCAFFERTVKLKAKKVKTQAKADERNPDADRGKKVA